MNNSRFIKIPNEYQDAKCRTRIDGQAMQILSVIERLTFGWNKKEAIISLKTFRKMTGLDDSHIIRSRKKLFKMGLITSSNPIRGRGTTLQGNRGSVNHRIQMDYTKWKSLPYRATTLQGNESTTLQGNKSLPYRATATPNSKYINVKDNSINTVKPKNETSDYEKAREVKIKTLHKKYKNQFEKAKKAKNPDFLDSINNKIKEELAEFSHKYHLKKERQK